MLLTIIRLKKLVCNYLIKIFVHNFEQLKQNHLFHLL
jgi:hypothetical protein